MINMLPEIDYLTGILCAYQKDLVLDFSRPDKPTDNAFIESVNGKFLQQCPHDHWFMSLGYAQIKLKEWCMNFNTVRPHSTIRNKPPALQMNGSTATSLP